MYRKQRKKAIALRVWEWKRRREKEREEWMGRVWCWLWLGLPNLSCRLDKCSVMRGVCTHGEGGSWVTRDADISCLPTYSIIMIMQILNILPCELKVWFWLLEKSACELIKIKDVDVQFMYITAPALPVMSLKKRLHHLDPRYIDFSASTGQCLNLEKKWRLLFKMLVGLSKFYLSKFSRILFHG